MFYSGANTAYTWTVVGHLARDWLQAQDKVFQVGQVSKWKGEYTSTAQYPLILSRSRAVLHRQHIHLHSPMGGLSDEFEQVIQ